MNQNFKEMKCFIETYFCMDYDLFGDSVDEIARYYVYEGIMSPVYLLVDEFERYLKDHFDDTDDVFFDKTFDHCYLYTSDYDNSVEFLKDVLNKIIFYRDQRLREEAAKKDA